MPPAVQQPVGAEILGRKGNGPRSERLRAKLHGSEVELRALKPAFASNPQRFLERTERLTQLSHPSLRMVREAVVLTDGRPAAVLSPVDWTPLSASPAQPPSFLIDMGIDLAEALDALHAERLVLGVLDGDDIFPGQPAVLDASLLGLAQDGDRPSGDVKMLALALLQAMAVGHEAGPLEQVLRRATSQERTARQLADDLTALRSRAQARTSAGNLPAVRVEPDLSGVNLGDWALSRMVGEGAMARVYLATHRRSGQHAAVKVLKQEHVTDPEFVQRFIQEVRAVEAIENPHVVKVSELGDQPLGESGRCVFCVMELLDGVALSEAMNLELFDVKRSVNIAIQAARCLHAAHQVGVVHRDIKPENLFLTRRPEGEFVKVLDFGIAKLLKPLGNLPKLGTKAGVVVGTPEYMAPEQATGQGADARVDVYAVGLVLYELLAGEQPFKGETFGKLVLEITQKPAPPLPATTRSGDRLPAGLSAVVLKCLEKDANARFPSASALADALEPFASANRPVSVPPSVVSVSTSGPVDDASLAAAIRPSRAPLIVLGLGALGVISAVAWWLLH